MLSLKGDAAQPMAQHVGWKHTEILYEHASTHMYVCVYLRVQARVCGFAIPATDT